MFFIDSGSCSSNLYQQWNHEAIPVVSWPENGKFGSGWQVLASKTGFLLNYHFPKIVKKKGVVSTNDLTC